MIAFLRFVFSCLFYSMGAISHQVNPYTERQEQLMQYGVASWAIFGIVYGASVFYLYKKKDYSYIKETIIGGLISIFVVLLYYATIYFVLEL